MSLGLYVQILPRLETFFLEEWLNHHLDLGIDYIYVYNNGFLSYRDCIHDEGYRELEDDEVGIKWDKKPDADYFEDYTNKEIEDKLNFIVESFDNVSLIPWRYEKEHNYGHPLNQVAGYDDCVNKNLHDWWLHIDPDEYLYLNKDETLKDFLNRQDKNTTSFLINQKVFNKRERDKPVREIFNWAYEIELTKSLVQAPLHPNDKMRINKRIHKTRSSSGKQEITNDMLIYHYRGDPVLNGGIFHKQFIGYEFDKIDRSMEKYIIPHETR